MNKGIEKKGASLVGKPLPVMVERDDSSIVSIECPVSDYSASRIARAVEDADTHLVDLLSSPGVGDKIKVMLRVRREDPSGVVHSLERYGYTVTEVESRYNSTREEEAWRWLQFQRMLNV